MSHGLLEILRFFFLALIWLFFVYVARVVLVEVRRSRPEHEVETNTLGEGSSEHRPVLRLRVVEPPEARGKTFELTGETTLGRSPACVIPLENDTFASSVHARVFARGSELWLEDLGSRNGTFLNSRRLAAPAQLHRGDRVKVGTTLLEISR
jgi:hypothetical protein